VKVSLWIDVRCPWTWMAAQWLVEDVAPHRDIDIAWEPMSLYLRKDPPESSPNYEKLWFTHRLLRVIQALKSAESEQAAGKAYFAFATLVWQGRDWDFAPADVLAAIGLEPSYATAFDEPSWDAAIQNSMSRAYAMIGDEAGNTPVLGITKSTGEPTAMYGPVLLHRPAPEGSLPLWDACVEMVTNPAFLELNSSQPDLPQFDTNR